MVTLVIHHRVADYDTWKVGFDNHQGAREAHGAIEHRVYRDLHDRHRVVIHIGFPSEGAARGFLEDPALKEAMVHAGVQGDPGFSYLEPVEDRDYE